ncbi:uncharacterized protein LOC124945761 [Impatiens glandulifera]|uniref:uncharacterized protein LOC124945761 n=1 Tax=Impatiens glandulifera TaxID=253017 RepID=UPI001FB1559E|nr:uncharacterized protein LOC124945761 [Impatiens glandulifera]
MEKSFAAEIYSESLKHSEAVVNPSSSAFQSQTTSNDRLNELTNEDDSPWGGSSDELEGPSDLDREWKYRHDQFHKIGYRDGLIAGKETSAQEGFNIGFKESVLVGYDWGLVRGFSSAFSLLPESLKEKLVETEEDREKFQSLEKSVRSIATTDALKLFNDEIVENDQPGEENQSGLKNNHPGSNNTLRDYYVKLTSLLSNNMLINEAVTQVKIDR